MKRLIVAAIVCLWCSPLLAAGWLPLAFQQCGGLPPSQAVAAGYNTQTVCSPMNSLSLLDLNNTLNPGYLLYMQNEGTTLTSSNFALGPGYLNILTNNPTTANGPTTVAVNSATFNPNIGTIIPPGGFYIEVQMQFDPTYNNNTKAWPAFWLQQPGWFALGDVTSFNTELDIMEWIGGAYHTTVHQWPTTNSQICQNANNAPSISTPNGFHTYGLLLIPSYNNSGTGLIEWYLDNVLQTTVTYTGTSTPSSGSCPAGAFQSADTQQYGIAFSAGTTGQGGGSSSAITSFKNLHVWQASATPTVPYQGPGDLITSGWAFWASIGRCFSSTFSGTIGDITDAATGNTTGTRLQCSGGVISAVVSASVCTFVTGNACSPLATTCAVACNIVDLYDQSGSGVCSTPLTQATNADRPTVTVNGLNGHSYFVTTSAQGFTATCNFTGTNKNTWSNVANGLTGVNTNFFTGFENGINNFGGNGGRTSTNTWFFYDGGTFPPTDGLITGVADNTWHAAQWVFNGASSVVNVDGTETNLTLATNDGLSSANRIAIGADVNGDAGGFQEAEVGLYAFTNGTLGVLSNVQRAMLCHNQYNYWGTATAC